MKGQYIDSFVYLFQNTGKVLNGSATKKEARAYGKNMVLATQAVLSMIAPGAGAAKGMSKLITEVKDFAKGMEAAKRSGLGSDNPIDEFDDSDIYEVAASSMPDEGINKIQTTAIQTYWPPNRGFLGTPKTETLQKGTLIDRYGSEYGSFVSIKGTPFQMRALHLKLIKSLIVFMK
ncbi:glycohydrolase toxin TNT-related protein [Alkalihalobacillus sp. AL-G]|uniref:glycohydrolase toxin TNT-related protein n=1 Tax=Alkalihalobacillus sp. AL-G TaxID=2926399 RepID=UPI00272C9638|nr:glycohydrolase toxin TNT-related protein [Alkalihalobacillus sp. AL-G]WLD93031.1 TNT domain-containing protein [Alkalihalobacillus sp. AL-G]